MTVDERAELVSRDDVRALFERHGEGELFEWAGELLDRIAQRASNHRHDMPPIRRVTGKLELPELSLQSPYIVLVDGDLEVAQDADLSTDVYATSLLVVMGDLRARHLRFAAGSSVYVKHRIVLRGMCFGDHGDEGAELYCELLRADGVLLDHVTCAQAAAFDAVVCANGDFGMPQHLDVTRSEGHAETFVPEVLDAEGRLDVARAWTAGHGGGPVFRQGAVERLRASAPSTAARVKP